MPRRSIWPTLVCLLILVPLVASPLMAQTKGEMENFLHQIGETLYAVAWPTATYEGVRFETTRLNPEGGLDIVFVLYGTSAFSGDSLWTEAILTLQDWQIKDLRWGRNNAILAPPGQTTSLILAQINREINHQKPSTPTQLVQSWTLRDSCDDGLGDRFRLFDLTGENVRLYWPNAEEDYLLGRSQSRTVKIYVSPGAKICYGAAPDQAGTKRYWGVGLNGTESCQDCCWTAETPNVSLTLSCE